MTTGSPHHDSSVTIILTPDLKTSSGTGLNASAQRTEGGFVGGWLALSRPIALMRKNEERTRWQISSLTSQLTDKDFYEALPDLFVNNGNYTDTASIAKHVPLKCDGSVRPLSEPDSHKDKGGHQKHDDQTQTVCLRRQYTDLRRTL